MDISLIEKINPSTEDIKLISKPLKDDNQSFIGEYNAYSYLLLLYQGKTFIGGSYSEIKLGWLSIDLLWIDVMYRRQGFGSTLLMSTEELAKKRGVLHARLTTGNFQGAFPFYRYHQYEVFAELEIFPEKENKKAVFIDYFMKKSLLLNET